MKDLKMFVGGGGEDKTSQDLPQEALQLIMMINVIRYKNYLQIKTKDG
jgi:hypothetical protein